MNFYVYGLFVGDDPIPRYIGMGHGYRCNNHIRNASRELVRNISPSKNLGILFAVSLGLPVVPKKLYDSLTKDEAVIIERRLIAEIGRADLLKGPLWNRSDGGFGSNNPSPSTRLRMSRSARIQLSSPQARQALRKAKLGNQNAVGNKSNTGKKFTPQHREKLRLAAIQRWAKNR